MVRLATAMVGDRSLAEDLVQDAFAEVFLRWRRLDNPGGYVRTCVVNRARRELRRLRRRPIEVECQAVSDGSVDERLTLLAAVRRLPTRRQAVIALRYYADLDDATIAETLGIRPGTVRATVHQALAQLRTELQR